MSPLDIEAETRFGIKAKAEGVGKALESNPVVIIGADGERAVDHKDDLRFVSVREGETIVIPDIEELGEITIETPFGLTISKTSFHPSSPDNDRVIMTLELEGTGFGPKPVTWNEISDQASEFKKPIPVEIRGQKIAEVSWREK